jgi:hypothetical protein
MKHLIILSIALFLGIAINAQTQKNVGWSIMPYDENEGYTIAEVMEFSKPTLPPGQDDVKESRRQADSIRPDWNKTLISMTNENLTRCAVMQRDVNNQILNVPFVIDNETNIPWILRHSYDSVVTLKNYSNTRKATQFGTKLDKYTDPGSFTGTVRVFKYENCSFIMYKAVCINLLGIPILTPYQAPPSAPQLFTKVTTPNGDTYISVSNVNTNNNTNTNNNNPAVATTPTTEPAQTTKYIVRREVVNNGFTTQQGWDNRIPHQQTQFRLDARFDIRGGKRKRGSHQTVKKGGPVTAPGHGPGPIVIGGGPVTAPGHRR